MKRPNSQPQPPRLAVWLARACVPLDRRAEVEGDLREVYRRIRERRGSRAAAIRCWREALLCAAWRLPVGFRPIHRSLRTHRSGGYMDSVLNDVRYAVRGLFRAPGFTLVAAGTLGLGIGANTALFSAAYGVLWRPLGITESERVVYLFQRNDQANERRQAAAPETFDFWRASANSLQSTGAWVWTSATLEHPDGAEELNATLLVGGDFFQVLGTQPLHGRTLRADDAAPGQIGTVVVLGQNLWERRFGADPAAVGTSIVLDGSPYTIVGVMPRTLEVPDPDVDVWLPREFAVEERALIGRLSVMARLADDVGVDAAQAEMDGLAQQLAEVSPDVHRGWRTDVVPIRTDVIGDSETGLLFAFGAAGLVLLMACLNVANLLLAKAVTRRREWALRSALGAGRAEVGRLVMLESLSVALLGGTMGIAAAALVHGGLVQLATNILPRAGAIRLDLPVLLFGVVLSVGAGVLFGMGPALHVLRQDPMAALRETTGAGAGKRANAVRTGLVAVQVALAVPMLIGAALLLQSLRELERVDPGFDPQRVIAARLFLDTRAYPNAESRRAYFRDLLARLRATPGVVAAGASSGLPLDPIGIDFSSPVDVPGREPAAGESRPRGDHRIVTPGYLDAMGLPLIRGRFIDETDRFGGPRAIVVNQALANQLWPGEDPLGRRVTVPFFGVNEYVVVGIVGNVRFRGLAAEPRPEIYTAHDQGPFGSMTVAVRTNGDPDALAGTLRQTVLALDSRQPVHSIVTADQLVAGAMSAERFYSMVSLLFALVALVLATGGLYGVMAYAVRQRTREIGVLLALGARPSLVTRQVVRRGLIVAGIGAAAGLTLAIAIARALRAVLYGVAALNPLMITAVVAVLLSAVVLASYVPARHAARIDPVRALRGE